MKKIAGFLLGMVLTSQIVFGMQNKKEEKQPLLPPTDNIEIVVEKIGTDQEVDAQKLARKIVPKKISKYQKNLDRACCCCWTVVTVGLSVFLVVMLVGWVAELPCSSRFAKEELSGYCKKFCEWFANHPDFCFKNGTTNGTASGPW